LKEIRPNKESISRNPAADLAGAFLFVADESDWRGLPFFLTLPRFPQGKSTVMGWFLRSLGKHRRLALHTHQHG
jgi:hypothetical protein